MKITITRSAVYTLFLATLALDHSGFASDKWGSKPSWAQEESGKNSKKTSSKEYLKDVTPFSPGSNNLAVELGQVFLMGGLGERYEDSLGLRLHYTYAVSEIFGFDSSLGYSSHSEGRFGMTSLLTGIRTNLSWYDRVIPHVVVGLGFYHPSQQLPNSVTSLSDTLFGIHLGPGIDLQISREMFFGASLTFHDVFNSTKQTAMGPMQLGGTYTAFLIRAGYTF
jgi:hypothetical protein